MKKNTLVASTSFVLACLPLCVHIVKAQELGPALVPTKEVNTAKPSQNFKPLTGQEALLEAIDRDGRIGVYALDILSKNPTPQLISLGSVSPRWSSNHQKILFFKNQTAQVCDRNGNIVAWGKDQQSDRFSNSIRLQSSKIWWDSSGKANLIYDWPFSGPQLSRSIGLREAMPTPTAGLRGFADQITPIYRTSSKRQNELSCIAAASISPKEDLLAAQVYPAMPYDIGKAQSSIKLYNLFYALNRTNPSLWKEKSDASAASFYANPVVPQVEAEGKIIGSPLSSSIDVEPLFSPSGKYIAFNRVDRTSRAISPTVVDITKPDTAIEVQIPPLSNESYFFPDRVAGWPTHSVIDWSDNEDTLWMVSGNEEATFCARLVGGTWKADLVCGVKFNRGRFSYYATYKNWFCCMYGDQQNRIYVFDKNNVQENPQFVDLPEQMQVRDIQW